MTRSLLLYLPVLHAGYEALLDAQPAGTEVLVLGTSFAARYRVVAKEIRALAPERAAAYVAAGHPHLSVRVVQDAELPAAVAGRELTLPDESLCRDVVADLALDAAAATLTWERTFLRWDRDWSRTGRPPGWDGRVSTDEVATAFAALALDVAARSSDWWRQVGAVAARGGELIGTAHNAHHPSEYSPYVDGDPRNEFRRGVAADLSTALHAEAAIVASAAARGVPLAGADLYVSTFPCPACARLVAAAGFARCFFAGPYSLLEGEQVLRAAGCEVLFVDLDGSGRELSFNRTGE